MPVISTSHRRFLIEDTAGTERDLSAQITEVHGLPGGRRMEDVTPLISDAPEYAVGHADRRVRLVGYYDATGTASVDEVLYGLSKHRSAVKFRYGPGGVDAGAIVYSGKCWVEDYQIGSRRDAYVTWTAQLVLEGALLRAAAS